MRLYLLSWPQSWHAALAELRNHIARRGVVGEWCAIFPTPQGRYLPSTHNQIRGSARVGPALVFAKRQIVHNCDLSCNRNVVRYETPRAREQMEWRELAIVSLIART